MATVGLVLSGGGARGAYEAGIVAGITEALGLRPGDSAPFQIFTGTSVGAINSTFLASHADRGDMASDELVKIWHGLSLETHLQVDPLRFLGVRQRLRAMLDFVDAERHMGRSLLNPTALERTVQRNVAWDRLHALVDEGKVHALIVAALRIADGRTTMFAETADGVEFNPSKDPRRVAEACRITASHVLASAAIPLVFPARRIGSAWYCDGGLRFNTPIAPAIRTGAEKLVVVSNMHKGGPGHFPVDMMARYPDPIFLLGKVLNALLLDPIDYDLQILRRFNALMGVIDDTLPEAERARLDSVVAHQRGAPYRRLDTLIFRPQADLGRLAGAHLRDHRNIPEIGRGATWLLRRAARRDATWEVDLASFVLFDGGFAEMLIAQGIEDVRARASEVRAFFEA